MGTAPLRALLLQVALVTLAAILAPRAKPAAIVLGAAAFLGAPWIAGPIALFRALAALVGGFGLLRVIDLVRFREPWSASRRVLHVLSFVDSRTLRRASPHADFLALGRAILWTGLAAAGYYVAYSAHAADSARSARLFMRWGGGLVFAYAVIESGYVITGAAYRALGFVAPRLHVLPLASLSIGELWGVRWARPVSAWLRETCFRPLARRGHPLLGLALGFVASGVGHAYPVVVAMDVQMAAMMFAFFVAQGIFVMIETRVGASRWPRVARRAWTVTIMIATSPLFVEPALRVLGCP
jgi:hypothetical protein